LKLPVDNEPNAELLASLRAETVRRHGITEELPDPQLGHCDDCHGFGAIFALGPGHRCFACWVRRMRVRQRLAARVGS
jgi:hypothetical protein